MKDLCDFPPPRVTEPAVGKGTGMGQWGPLMVTLKIGKLFQAICTYPHVYRVNLFVIHLADICLDRMDF